MQDETLHTFDTNVQPFKCYVKIKNFKAKKDIKLADWGREKAFCHVGLFVFLRACLFALHA